MKSSRNPAQKLDTPALESWLWDAACIIRGAVDAPKFKDYILPLIFIKRLSDVYEDELARLAEQLGDVETAREMAERDHGLVRFFLPRNCMWPEIRKLTKDIGRKLTDVVRDIADENEHLQGVIDTVDFNAAVSGERIIPDEKLSMLIEIISRYRIGPAETEPDIIGRAYEYLIRKFAEGQGQTAGEFYTPREVGLVLAYILDPKPGETVYDFACGSAGLLIKCQLVRREKHDTAAAERPLQLKAFPALVPPMDQQRGITDVMQGVDQKIAAEEKRRNALDLLFCTLLSHLMTGKVRVNHLDFPASLGSSA
jgi:type I restriction enzyme M protein